MPREGYVDFTIFNESIVGIRWVGGHVQIDLWAEGKANAVPRSFVFKEEQHVDPAIAAALPWQGMSPWRLLSYQMNQNAALLQYELVIPASDRRTRDVERIKYELWFLSHPEVHLILPNYDSFLTEEERGKEQKHSGSADWQLDSNSNSQYLIRQYSCGEGSVGFVLVFHGFQSSKYQRRITMPENVWYDAIKMVIIGSGKDAKTVLTAQTDQFQFFVFDMSSGQTLLTIPLRRQHCISEQYLFPLWELNNEDHELGGVDVIRIECNGENWTTCTIFASYDHVEGHRNGIRLDAVTDTQTVWEVNSYGSSELILCDYLLNELH